MEMEKITLGMKPKKEAEDVRNDNYKMLKKDIKKKLRDKKISHANRLSEPI